MDLIAEAAVPDLSNERQSFRRDSKAVGELFKIRVVAFAVSVGDAQKAAVRMLFSELLIARRPVVSATKSNGRRIRVNGPDA